MGKGVLKSTGFRLQALVQDGARPSGAAETRKGNTAAWEEALDTLAEVSTLGKAVDDGAPRAGLRY